MAMTRNEFAEFVTPEQLAFVLEVLRLAWDDYANPDNYSPVARLAHHRALRAQIRNGHILHRARTLLSERPELAMQLKVIRQRPLLIINGRAWLSFKKLNKQMRHSNYPTSQATAFDAQLWPAGMLPDVADDVAPTPLWDADAMPAKATNVVGGYLPNAAETDYSVFLICPDGEGNAWVWPLAGSDIVELMASAEPTQTQAAAKIRKLPIRVRPEVGRKQSTDGSAG